jgi:hypothetical protein
MLEELLSPTAKKVFHVLWAISLVVLVYFFFLGRGPAHTVAVWMGELTGYFSFTLSLLLAALPIIFAEWFLVFLGDKLFGRLRQE